jgi:hypothetical protein
MELSICWMNTIHSKCLQYVIFIGCYNLCLMQAVHYSKLRGSQVQHISLPVDRYQGNCSKYKDNAGNLHHNAKF